MSGDFRPLVEKANPDIPGLYAVIKQLFCSNAFSHMTYVNREQDLGEPGLRKAKESYHPHHLINKYTLIPR
ncbi:MAG: phosphatidylglycerol lysyltransferase domain-containing protein [Thermodesulfobacteriota bacterium]